jgi:hypothetical protein
MYVLEPCAFNAEFQYFIPLVNKKNYDFAHNSQQGMKQHHQMRGATQAQQTGHDFTTDNSPNLWNSKWWLVW